MIWKVNQYLQSHKNGVTESDNFTKWQTFSKEMILCTWSTNICILKNDFKLVHLEMIYFVELILTNITNIGANKPKQTKQIIIPSLLMLTEVRSRGYSVRLHNIRLKTIRCKTVAIFLKKLYGYFHESCNTIELKETFCQMWIFFISPVLQLYWAAILWWRNMWRKWNWLRNQLNKLTSSSACRYWTRVFLWSEEIEI